MSKGILQEYNEIKELADKMEEPTEQEQKSQQIDYSKLDIQMPVDDPN